MSFYVYTYFFDDIPRYVGKGIGDRWKKHRKNKTQLGNKLRKVFSTTGNWVLPVVEFCLNEEEAKNNEIALITLYGRLDLCTGTLWNLTNGGEGTSGHIVSESTKQKIKTTFKNPVVREKHSAATSKGMGSRKTVTVKPIKRSVECNQKISLTTKLAMEHPEVRKKLSAKRKNTSIALKGRKLSERHCENISKSHRKFSDEIIKKIYYAVGTHKDISVRFNVSASHVGCIKRLERDIYRVIILGEESGIKIP